MQANPVRVAILDDFQQVALGMADWSRLKGRAEVSVFTDNVRDDALLERLLPFDAVCAIRERTAFPRSLLERLPKLKLIATAGMRNKGIDLAACAERGITVSGTSGGSSPTAELAFGLILALSRNIVAEDRSLRAGHWSTPTLGSMIEGRTLGVVGLGKLGSQVARFAQAFGMKTIAWSQNLTEAKAAEQGCRLVDKATLFRTSDYITLHLVMSERSRGTVGAADLALMQPGAFLINTSRSGLVDGPSLVAALTEKRIAGAALDVFDIEPIPADDPILAAPNTILTPHLGYATRESYEGYFPAMVEDIEAWLDGTPIRVLPLE
jgi:phosphoglycerate dehydrogenase-like enzyme